MEQVAILSPSASGFQIPGNPCHACNHKDNIGDLLIDSILYAVSLMEDVPGLQAHVSAPHYPQSRRPLMPQPWHLDAHQKTSRRVSVSTKRETELH